MFKIFNWNKVLPPAPIKENPHIFNKDDYSGWGRQICWRDVEKLTLYGWVQNPKIEVGDYLRNKMTTGKYGLFEFIEVKYESDPKDMFWAKVRFLKYEDE